MSDEPRRQTILSVQRDVNRETAAVIPSYSANQRTINRVKQEKRPRMQEPQSLTYFELPELLKHSGERFLHFDSGPNDTNRIMVFTTLPGLDLLNGADDWFCKHPSFPNLIKKLQDEQKNAEILIKKCVPGKECHVLRNHFLSNLTKKIPN